MLPHKALILISSIYLTLTIAGVGALHYSLVKLNTDAIITLTGFATYDLDMFALYLSFVPVLLLGIYLFFPFSGLPLLSFAVIAAVVPTYTQVANSGRIILKYVDLDATTIDRTYLQTAMAGASLLIIGHLSTIALFFFDTIASIPARKRTCTLISSLLSITLFVSGAGVFAAAATSSKNVEIGWTAPMLAIKSINNLAFVLIAPAVAGWAAIWNRSPVIRMGTAGLMLQTVLSPQENIAVVKAFVGIDPRSEFYFDKFIELRVACILMLLGVLLQTLVLLFLAAKDDSSELDHYDETPLDALDSYSSLGTSSSSLPRVASHQIKTAGSIRYR